MTLEFNIIGGVYQEYCTWPEHDTIQGSAGRAALCLSQLDQSMILLLHSQMAKADETMLKQKLVFCSNCNLNILPSNETIKFDYFHPLSEPKIIPKVSSGNIPLFKPITKKVDSAIIFGMIEATPVIDCKTAIYDPQNTYNPVLFSDNGCADNLAYVLNSNELKNFYSQYFGKHESIEKMAKWLASKENAEVVVVKNGYIGAFVYSSDKKGWVAPLKTNSIFPIGSGDAFVAAFAYYWRVKGLDPLSAVNKSSVAAAYYAKYKTMNNPEGLDEFERQTPIAKPTSKRKKIYLAGPFFTLSELWMINETKYYLELFGMDVFSPYHEIGIGTADEVVQKDIDAIVACDALYAIFDGTDPGTLYEIGYARSIKKEVVIIAENPKAEELKMYDGSGCQIYGDFTTSIYQTSWLEI